MRSYARLPQPSRIKSKSKMIQIWVEMISNASIDCQKGWQMPHKRIKDGERSNSRCLHLFVWNL